MHATDEYYNKINRVVLKILGLWPYEQSYFGRIQKVFFISILLTFIFVQLLLFVTTQYDTNLLLKILSFVLPMLFCFIKYCIFIIQRDSVKQMLKQNQDNWKLVKDKLEIDIIKKYSYIARILSIILMGLCCFALIMFTILQFLPLIFDIILPLNESRSCRLIIITEYFVNQEKYIYAIFLHHILAISVAIIALCSASSTFLMYILHTCALLNIASYRIENAMEWNMSAISSSTIKYLVYRRIVHAVIIHRRAMEFIKFVTSEFTVLFAILIVIGVSSLSLNLLQFLQLITLTNNMTEILVYALLIFAHLTYMFGANYAGQIVTDHGIKLFKATYNGKWYMTPLHTQKMLLFIMQRGTIYINIGSIFTASLEGFAMLVNAAVSYFTMIYSTQQ
ncbi:odorant receptor 22c-like [Polyergus mexicanus]|uniref:odorant receptor 22c-like n=1 Tax=Polyergus mexicanus TaxID=615972 RepID=UPI0038B51E39